MSFVPIFVPVSNLLGQYLTTGQCKHVTSLPLSVFNQRSMLACDIIALIAATAKHHWLTTAHCLSLYRHGRQWKPSREILGKPASCTRRAAPSVPGNSPGAACCMLTAMSCLTHLQLLEANLLLVHVASTRPIIKAEPTGSTVQFQVKKYAHV